MCLHTLSCSVMSACRISVDVSLLNALRCLTFPTSLFFGMHHFVWSLSRGPISSQDPPEHVTFNCTLNKISERENRKGRNIGWERTHWVFTLICVILRTNPSCKFNTDLARNVDEESEKNHCALHSGKRKSLASFSNAKIQTNITFCDTCSFLPLQE